MTTLIKGGREITVPDERVAEYLRDGYSAVLRGQIIDTPLHVPSYAELLASVRALEQQNKALRAQVNELSTVKKRTPKTV